MRAALSNGSDNNTGDASALSQGTLKLALQKYGLQVRHPLLVHIIVSAANSVSSYAMSSITSVPYACFTLLHAICCRECCLVSLLLRALSSVLLRGVTVTHTPSGSALTYCTRTVAPAGCAAMRACGGAALEACGWIGVWANT